MGAVIDDRAFRKHRQALEEAKASPDVEIIAGGGADDSVGYFVEPTVLRVDDPRSRFMQQELFGPIVSVFVYDDADYEGALELVDTTSPYGLTGSVFAEDRSAITAAERALRFAAGNFYVNDKPTGAIVGQQPFGGARRSGTNDKAGSMWNLIRWVSPRAIKETFVPPTDYRYPFMAPDPEERG
jgi:1-pyrroline-5-carboxylate dehydrogenase